MLRWLTAGESHGPALVASPRRAAGRGRGHDRRRRRRARPAPARLGRGARMSFEQDEVEFLGGVRHGLTLGGPVADPDRQHRVAQVGDGHVAPTRSTPTCSPGQARNAPLTRPRPGHADLVGMQKYGFDDARPVLERASARETAARVALGAVAKAFLRAGRRRRGAQPRRRARRGRARPRVACPRPTTCARDRRRPGALPRPGRQRGDGQAEVEAAHRDGDTLGGVVEVVVHGLPPGLGSHVHWDRRLDARLAGALMGIQAIKGVEVGDGFELARTRGSLAQDEIESTDGRRASPHAGAPAAPRAA